jgi:hypothetical protein
VVLGSRGVVGDDLVGFALSVVQDPLCHNSIATPQGLLELWLFVVD